MLSHAREPIRFSSRDIGSVSRMFQLDDMPLVAFPATNNKLCLCHEVMSLLLCEKEVGVSSHH